MIKVAEKSAKSYFFYRLSKEHMLILLYINYFY